MHSCTLSQKSSLSEKIEPDFLQAIKQKNILESLWGLANADQWIWLPAWDRETVDGQMDRLQQCLMPLYSRAGHNNYKQWWIPCVRVGRRQPEVGQAVHCIPSLHTVSAPTTCTHTVHWRHTPLIQDDCTTVVCCIQLQNKHGNYRRWVIKYVPNLGLYQICDVPFWAALSKCHIWVVASMMCKHDKTPEYKT